MDEIPRSRLTPVVQRVEPDEYPGFASYSQGSNTPPASCNTQNELDIFKLFAVLWHGKWFIILCAFLAVLAGGYYAFKIAVPMYSSDARLALKARDQNVVDLESVISGVSTEIAAINTELEVIQSRTLVERLVNELNLAEDPEFNGRLRTESQFSVSGIKRLIRELIFGATPEGAAPTDKEVTLETVDAVQGAISVSSQRNTYLFEIRVTTENPQKSADIANKLAQIYLDDQIGVKFAATEYAINWLSERVTDLEIDLKRREDELKNLRGDTDLVSIEALEALNARAKTPVKGYQMPGSRLRSHQKDPPCWTCWWPKTTPRPSQQSLTIRC